jgi:hypothetical protein
MGSCLFAAAPLSILGWIYDPDHSLSPGMYVDVPHLDCLLVAVPRILIILGKCSAAVGGVERERFISGDRPHAGALSGSMTLLAVQQRATLAA